MVLECDFSMAVDMIKRCLEGGIAMTIIRRMKELAQQFVRF